MSLSEEQVPSIGGRFSPYSSRLELTRAQCPIFQNIASTPFLFEGGRNCFTFSLFCLFPSSSTHSVGHAWGSLKENWYEFLSRWGMPDVCFSSLFFCRITRCQRGGPPLDPHSRTGWQFCALGAPRKADDGADQLDYYCPASQKSGNWQLLSKWCWGWELNTWTISWQFWKRAQEPENYNVRPLWELDGDWTRRRCSVRLSLPVLSKLPPQYHNGGGVERERTYENYRTPTARDNPSIRGEVGRVGRWQVGVWDSCSLQTMPDDGGDGRNLEQLLLSLKTLRSDLEQYPDQPRSQTISRPTLHQSRSGRWIATRFLKTVWSTRGSGILSLSTMKSDLHICKTTRTQRMNMMWNLSPRHGRQSQI